MRVLKKNTHVDLATGRRTDQLVGDGQTVDIETVPLTPAQTAALREFERTMRDEVIPEIERVLRRRARLAQESGKWIIL
jgi:hypothetical protein